MEPDSEDPEPERDETLGTKENPARDCTDIKHWGPEDAKSGSYFVKFNDELYEVFCDMDTDDGGWTLFFNYIHVPGQNLILDQSVNLIDIDTAA